MEENSTIKNLRNDRNNLISVIVPAYNEEKGINFTIREISQVLSNQNIQFEIIVVDDGSSDRTFEHVEGQSKEFGSLKGIQLSRNFGKEAALLAGLMAARGDALITIDADLQHPPSLIPKMIDKWREGAKVVNAIKGQRKNDSLFARWRAAAFNNLLKILSGIDVSNSSDFKLLDRDVVNILTKQMGEHKRFYRGLANWVGYQQENILFDTATRLVGKSRWSIKALIELATTGVVSFTSAPLRIITFLGVITLIFALLVSAEAFWSWLQGKAVSGFATIIITLLLIGSFIMISLGILGEYVAKIYDEIKNRPNFLVEKSFGFDD